MVLLVKVAINSDWLVEGRECVKNLSTLTGLLGKRVCEKAINSDWLVGKESVLKSYQLWLACWGKRVCEKAINSDWLVGEECVKKLATLTGLLGKFEKAIIFDWLVGGVWKSYHLWLACGGKKVCEKVINLSYIQSYLVISNSDKSFP
jgi:hypothetical protein